MNSVSCLVSWDKCLVSWDKCLVSWDKRLVTPLIYTTHLTCEWYSSAVFLTVGGGPGAGWRSQLWAEPKAKGTRSTNPTETEKGEQEEEIETLTNEGFTYSITGRYCSVIKSSGLSLPCLSKQCLYVMHVSLFFIPISSTFIWINWRQFLLLVSFCSGKYHF